MPTTLERWSGAAEAGDAPVSVGGVTAAVWQSEGDGIRVRILEPALAEPALVAALTEAGADPRAEGRYTAFGVGEDELRALLPASATLTPLLPGEWWVEGAEGAGDPRLDPDLGAPEDRVGRVLAAAGDTVATAESCTGGAIAERLTAVPGSSGYMDRGWVVYTNAAKEALLGVPGGILAKHGAVSEPVARALVTGALERGDARLAVAVTGVAGPSGGTSDKPVGTVWLAAGRRDGTMVSRCPVFPGSRGEVRWRSVSAALALLMEAMEA